MSVNRKMMKIKSLFRRGHSQQSAAPSTSSGVSKNSAPLRGASSVSSLDSKHKIAPINPLKPSKAVGSRDKLDKLHLQKTIQGKQHDKGMKIILIFTISYLSNLCALD